MSISSIAAERVCWGDPVEIVLNATVNVYNKPLHAVVYANNKFELHADDTVLFCTVNAGGDPTSGCDNPVNPHGDLICDKHAWFRLNS